MLIPSHDMICSFSISSLSRRVNANSQPARGYPLVDAKLIKKGEC